MMSVKERIDNIITEVMEQKGISQSVPINGNMNLVNDLGFSSLDIAQVVASLELEFDADPFSEGVTVADLVNVENFYYIYEKYA